MSEKSRTTAMKSIFVLTGAGISAESGIQTLRGSDGLWEEHRLEEVASPDAFQRDPSMVFGISPHFDEHLRGPATVEVLAWVDGVLAAVG
jgi:NAD-dependent deacetylase